MMQTIGGGLPAGISEIKTGSFYAESNVTSLKTFAHGCNGTPDIIVMWSDYKTIYTSELHPSNTTIVAAHYDYYGGTKSYASVPNTYSGGGDASGGARAALTSADSGQISNVNIDGFDVLCASNRRLGAGLTYKWIAIRLTQ